MSTRFAGSVRQALAKRGNQRDSKISSFFNNRKMPMCRRGSHPAKLPEASWANCGVREAAEVKTTSVRLGTLQISFRNLLHQASTSFGPKV